jgi:DNA topoisomerase-1
MAFRSASYWDLDAVLDAGADAEPPTFPARLTHVGARKVAQGRDFDSRGQLIDRGAADLLHLDQPQAEALAASLRGASFRVGEVESKPYTRRPYAPFRTTTLQQEAGRKLGFTAQRTMSVAQDLYEAGFITYMRTDSVTLSDTAITAARNQVRQLFGPDYLPDKPRIYASKVKNAQEAHEAIRPAGEVFQTPAQTRLTGDQFRLYELIWMRTIASQMKDAEGQTISVKIIAQTAPESVDGRTDAHQDPDDILRQAQDAGCIFVASGRTINFYGFLKAYVEAHDESDEAQSDDAQTRLPRLTEGQRLRPEAITASGHDTRPPARYTEPSLVAKLEELEIGRPSTYATILRTITARDYVFKKGSALVPTWLAFAVTRLLEEHFPKLVDYAFTAEMEEVLDQIADGHAERVHVLTDFYFGSGDREGLQRLVSELGEIDARKLSTFPIGDLDSGIVVRVGRYGTYVENDEGRRSNVPDDLPPDELTIDLARELLSRPAGEERVLGTDPDTGLTVIAKNGRFGPYVTEVLAEDAPKSAKPRTGSLFSSMSIDQITLSDALRLMSLPRVVGVDSDGREITAQNGRYGPYLKKDSDSRSLSSEEQIFSITLDEANAIYAQPKQRGRASAKPPLKELGPDPTSGRPMIIKDGRFGAYVTDGEINATLRRQDDPETITAARAAELLAEKRAKGPAPKRPTRKATAKKSTARKQSTAGKATADGPVSTAKKAAPKVPVEAGAG